MPGLKRRSPRQGFTLIELMIVIGLIALLAGILLPSFQRARVRANLTTCGENLRNLATAVSMYQTDNAGLLPRENVISNGSSTGGYITSSFTQLRRYVPNAPKCPLERARTYSYYYAVYKSAAGRLYWQLLCYTSPSLHRDMGCPGYYPRWMVNYPGYPHGLVLKP